MGVKLDGISVILLIHNEIETIHDEIQEWSQLLSEIPNSELILTEDGSSDGTTEYLNSISDSKIVKCQSKFRRGYRQAFIDAVEKSQFSFVFLADTGRKHDLNDFWSFYHRRKHFDLINGLKVHRQDSFIRIMMTKILNLIIRHLFGIKVFDADCGFRLYNKKILEKTIKTCPEFNDFINLELTLKFILNGNRYLEVPITYFQRKGKSRSLPIKKLPKKISRLLLELLRLRKSYHFKY